MLKGEWSIKSLLKILGIMLIAIMISTMVYNKSLKQLFKAADKNTEQLENEDSTSEDDSNTINNTPTTSYKDIQEKMTTATQKYIDDHYDNGLEKDYLYTVSLKQLQTFNFMDLVYDPYDNSIKCSGYVTYIMRDRLIINPYLKCDTSYQSDGYNASFDE